jgi:methylation protein EvaC
MSKTMQKSSKKLSVFLKKKFNCKKILEIGSNDGLFLKKFPRSIRVGVEPCKNFSAITNKINIKTYNNFWNLKLAEKLKKKYKSFNIIYSANTISHIHDLDETFKSIEILLEKKSIFIIDDPSMLKVLQNNSYDQFYDEHAYVFSLTSLKKLISKHNLEIFNVLKLNTHGGSNRVFICKKNSRKINNNVARYIKEEKKFGIDKFSTYVKFAKRVKKSKKNLIKIFKNIKKEKKIIIGYGATAKSSTVLNYCNINKNYIKYFIDTTKEKGSKFTPGSHIPIINQYYKINDDVDYAFLGAWNFEREIILKENDFIKRGGKFITHIPHPRVFP